MTKSNPYMERDLKRVILDSTFSPQNFTFDRIYNKTTSTQNIYKESCRSIVHSLTDGFHGKLIHLITNITYKN